MYKKIYIPVDNSDHSNQAVAMGMSLGRAFESEVIGSHVYPAKMHDYRFKQMEYTLPDEYLEETELDRQRQIHDSLITMGLQLISDSYLEGVRKQCQASGLKFTPKMMDGKHHVEILKDIEETRPDVVVLGAQGIGRVRDSHIGVVCERVARHSPTDVWVIKSLPGAGGPSSTERDTIVVAIDGSPQSFGALMTAIELGREFDKKIECISVYDPYLHYSVFNGVVDVLTEKAAKVFRFEEQNQLHEEIIDCGLAQIYQSHLDVAFSVARDENVEIERTLRDGKAFQKILDHVRQVEPWLLVLGRIGVHSDRDDPGLGSNTENLLRAAPCDILLTTRLLTPELDVKAEESIRWTPEAEERMQNVPLQVQGIARTAIFRLAMEQGYSVISSDVLDQAMERFMPMATASRTEQLAEALALDAVRQQPTSICKSCGVTARQPDPVQCAVCGGKTFQVITEEMLEKIAAMEGGAEAERAYDGKTVKWTQEAKRALWTMKDAYKRRRAKARVEKGARIKKLSTITLEFARELIEDEAGVAIELGDPAERTGDVPPAGGGNGEPGDGEPGDRALIARDDKKNPLVSAWEWDADAVQRLFRVPPGYMRDKTQERAERLAREGKAETITDSLVNEGIEVGRKLMEQLLAAATDADSAAAVPAPASVAPDGAADGNGKSESKCPFAGMAVGGLLNPNRPVTGGDDLYLNEVGLMSALAEKRKRQNEQKE